MRDIYSLVAGFYPLVGSTGAIEYHTHRSSYGIAGSAASVANYYLNNESIPVQTNLPGNVTILGQTLGNRPKHISDTEEPEVLGVLNNQNVIFIQWLFLLHYHETQLLSRHQNLLQELIERNHLLNTNLDVPYLCIRHIDLKYF